MDNIFFPENPGINFFRVNHVVYNFIDVYTYAY